MMLFILHEHIISNLSESAAVATGLAVGAAGSLCVVYKEHLRIGSAGSVFKSPPVILGGKVVNILFLKSRKLTEPGAFFISGSILVTCENCCRKMIGVKSEHLGKKLEAPFAALLLEVVSKAPASHHLEKCKVALIAHGVYIIGAHAALYIAEPCSLWMLLTQQIRHKRLHSCDIEHNTRRSVRYK